VNPLVVLTRPEGSNEPLAAMLRARGWSTLVQPMLRIEPLPDEQRSPVPDLPTGARCIFISANAAKQALPALKEPLRRADAICCAVGAKTASVLAEAGFTPQVPEQPDSEGLLALPALVDVNEQTVLIVKGEGGRGLLAKTLIERGAKVIDYIGYRRVPEPDPDSAFKERLLGANALVFQAASGETLEQLTGLLKRIQCEALLAATLVVPSERVAHMAHEAGWRTVLTAVDASDQAFLDALGIEAQVEAQVEGQIEAQIEGIEEQLEDAGPEGHTDAGLKAPAQSSRHRPNTSVAAAMPATPSDKESKVNSASTAKRTSPPSPPRADRFARFLAVCIVLSAIAAAAAAYVYLWPQWLAQTQTIQTLQQQLAQVQEDQQRFESGAQRRLEAGLNAATARVTAMGEERLASAARERAERATLDQRIDDRLQRLELRLARLTATDRRAWLAQEAAFLIRLAGQRLLTSRDIDSAQALLRNADRLLAEADDPRLTLARNAIARDIAQLQAAPRIDTIGLQARFSALVTLVDELRVRPEQPTPQAAVSGDSFWQRAGAGWQAALTKLSSYLVITRREDARAAIMTPDLEVLLRQNLRMLLEQGQIAALSANQSLYDSAIDRAAAFAAQFSAVDPERSAVILSSLSELATQTIAPPLPDLVATDAAVTDAIRLLDSDAVTGPDPLSVSPVSRSGVSRSGVSRSGVSRSGQR